MSPKEYSEKELADLGRKVLAMRGRQRENAKARNQLKTVLYRMYKAGEFGDLKV